MKAVILSLRPQWCEKIFNGEKTIEVRKTYPKLDRPFIVYVYQTKHKGGKKIVSEVLNSVYGGGKVIGSFVCDRIICCQAYYGDSGKKHLTNLFGVDTSKICLSELEIFDYIIGKDKKDGIGWLWHISDLKIYEKPKELSDFSKYEYKYLGGCCVNNNCKNYIYNGYYQPPECKIDGCFFKRPPQSWCYVKELL